MIFECSHHLKNSRTRSKFWSSNQLDWQLPWNEVQQPLCCSVLTSQLLFHDVIHVFRSVWNCTTTYKEITIAYSLVSDGEEIEFLIEVKVTGNCKVNKTGTRTNKNLVYLCYSSEYQFINNPYLQQTLWFENESNLVYYCIWLASIIIFKYKVVRCSLWSICCPWELSYPQKLPHLHAFLITASRPLSCTRGSLCYSVTQFRCSWDRPSSIKECI